jgi:diaminopimelate decarboxylase
VNALLPGLWSAGVDKDEQGELRVAGVGVRQIAADFGTPVYVVDEADLRARARRFAAAFAGWDVYYAGKSFLCTAVAQWVTEEGLGIDVCTGGELAVVQRARVDLGRVGLHGNNKSEDELARPTAGVSHIVVDSFDDRQTERLTSVRPQVMVRVSTGVEAHTHEYIATAHEDQKFGFSIAGGAAAEALESCFADPNIDLIGIHSHIGSQIFDPDGFEVAARRTLRLHADFAREHGVELAELDLGGGFGIAYTSADTPSTPEELARALRDIISAECVALGVACRSSAVEPGGDQRCFALYRVGTVTGPAGRWRKPPYVAADGG